VKRAVSFISRICASTEFARNELSGLRALPVRPRQAAPRRPPPTRGPLGLAGAAVWVVVGALTVAALGASTGRNVPARAERPWGRQLAPSVTRSLTRPSHR